MPRNNRRRRSLRQLDAAETLYDAEVLLQLPSSAAVSTSAALEAVAASVEGRDDKDDLIGLMGLVLEESLLLLEPPLALIQAPEDAISGPRASYLCSRAEMESCRLSPIKWSCSLSPSVAPSAYENPSLCWQNRSVEVLAAAGDCGQPCDPEDVRASDDLVQCESLVPECDLLIDPVSAAPSSDSQQQQATLPLNGPVTRAATAAASSSSSSSAGKRRRHQASARGPLGSIGCNRLRPRNPPRHRQRSRGP